MKTDIKPLIIMCALAACTFVIQPTAAEAREFTECFSDSTIRLDYIFSGSNEGVSIALKDKHKSPGWYGRVTNLDHLHLGGNGDVTVTTVEGDTLYCNSFSSLFNEWLALNDPVPSAHEATVLVPMPRDPVNVTVRVLDSHHRSLATVTHRIDPADILIKHKPVSATNDHIRLHQGSYPGHRINVAILPEGYTEAELATFVRDASETVDAILSHEPFSSMRDRFDFYAVLVPSRESGVSIPRLGQWRDTAFNSHFSTFYSDRYLTSPSVFAMHDALDAIPYEHIIVLANTSEYGGGGIFNDYTLTAAHHPKFRPVVVHEFGHSFGGLADEYFYLGDVMDDTYPTDVEPWEPNITTLVDFDSKWRSMIADGTPLHTPTDDAAKYPVGLYEGGGYSFKGIYRPADWCRMRTNDIDHFCPVCQKAMTELIKYYTE